MDSFCFLIAALLSGAVCMFGIMKVPSKVGKIIMAFCATMDLLFAFASFVTIYLPLMK